MSQFLSSYRHLLEEFAQENHLRYLALFGSHARGEETETSDVDLLAEFSAGTSLFDVVRMERELEGKLDKKVDLISRKYVNRHVKPYIQQDIVPIYEQG